MDSDNVYADRLQAQMRAADARLEELEASARARNAQGEMNEISGLRARREQVRQRLADVRQKSRDDWQSVRRELDIEWSNFRQAIADAQGRYAAWDQAREKRFNAHLDEAEAALRRSAAEDAVVAADIRIRIAETRDGLKAKAAAARRNYQAWRERRSDERAIRDLNASELELDEALDQYAMAVQSVAKRASTPRGD